MCEPSNWRKQQFACSDNNFNLIGQYLVLLFILTFDWSLETIQIFLKLDGLFKAEVNVPAKTIQFILTLDSWQKLIKNRSVGNTGFSCSYIIIMKHKMSAMLSKIMFNSLICVAFSCQTAFLHSINHIS